MVLTRINPRLWEYIHCYSIFIFICVFKILHPTAFFKTTILGDFPGGPVVKNPPSNAGDVGLIPGRGTKIPHAAGQLSLHATTTELVRLN